jgi:hypothetical protein
MLNNEQRKIKTHAASTLIKMTCLKDDEILGSMSIETNQINWEVLDSIERLLSEKIIYEVLKVILTDKCELSINDLLLLDIMNREAVLLALHTAFGLQQIDEQLLN